MSDTEISGGRPLPAAPAGSVLAVLERGLGSPKTGALLTVVAAAALGAGLIAWSLRPDYVPLGEQGSRADTLLVVEALTSAGVEYRLDPSTGLVLVPREDLSRVQLDLAAAGLGERSAVGLELLNEDSALGTSHFTETARYQHALETELARTISGLRNIESARVHLALPAQSVFVRERGSASASVTLKSRAGRTIEDEQVEAVVNLVASSIPHLETGQVAVVDQWGRLLSRRGGTVGDETREQYEYARRLERLYSERIESLLLPIVGEGRVRAIVTADLDFSLNERTREEFDPDPAQLRSEQEETSFSEDPLAAGVPGALTNQPPGVGVVEPEVAAAEAANLIDRSSSTIRNFELDKTITHERQVPGGVRRLSAAVIIDDRMLPNEQGELVRTPLTEEELAEYTALAREAIGFDAARGDSVAVFNRAFQPATEVEPIEPLPLWERPWVWTMVRQSLVGLAVLLLVLVVLRPAVRRLGAAPIPRDGRPRDEASADEAAVAALGGPADMKETDLLNAPPVVYGDILNMARAMAAEDPKRVAKVVKEWVGQP